MSSPSAFNPSTSVSFVIKNNSSIKRSIKVFNFKLNPGGVVDLMKLAGVTEEDIRTEVLKGSLRPLLAGGSLQVVSSSINFVTADNSHYNFLKSIGILAGQNQNGTALTQAAWQIDPVNGIDTNSGLPGSPLKTNAEFSRRLGDGNTISPPGTGGTIPVFLPITYLNSAPIADPLNLDVILGPQVQLQFIGTPGITTTPLAVSAVRTKVRSSNTPWALTLTSGTAGPSVATRISDTTNVNSNYFWGLKDETAGVLRTTEPYNAVVPIANAGYPQSVTNSSRFTPVNTDTYVTQTLPTLTLGSIRITGIRGVPSPIAGGPESYRPGIMFQDLHIASSDVAILANNDTDIICYGCLFDRDLEFGQGTIFKVTNCLLAKNGGATQAFWYLIGGFSIWTGGGMINMLPVNVSGTVRFDMDVVFQKCVLTVLSGSRWLMGTWAVFDGITGGPGNNNPTGDGIRVAAGASLACYTDVDITNFAWGAGNTGAGIGLGGGASLQWEGTLVSAPISITGSTPGTNDFAFRGITGSGTITSSYTMSATGVVSGPFTDSWSNFFNASNFGGTAANLPTNAWIIPSGKTV